ncbi:single-stranded DNA-binding protein [Chlorobium sp. KB01]|uniref:single-stranded DNA-binding protein n=1 Tax=Chlorobium sp. KB01 TaxID=1917528 RepID=UPI0009769151|nr:single-stranded DNA-binding protein [Chlorobium sp. KB01]
MARGLNKVMLIGRLGKDPVSRQAGSNTVCNFTIATSETFKDAQGSKQERTEWHNIAVWGRLGEICQQYLTKGREVYIEGKLQTRSWDDPKSGEKKYATDIICTDMQMLGGQRDQGAGMGGYHEGGASNYERQPDKTQQRDYSQSDSDYPAPSAPPSAPLLESDKDDLPF